MRPEDMNHQITTRTVPLPEERAAEQGGEDRRGEAAEILRESEERTADAADAVTPSDAAVEHRRSADTVES